jgi:hypothetical protein
MSKAQNSIPSLKARLILVLECCVVLILPPMPKLPCVDLCDHRRTIVERLRRNKGSESCPRIGRGLYRQVEGSCRGGYCRSRWVVPCCWHCPRRTGSSRLKSCGLLFIPTVMLIQADVDISSGSGSGDWLWRLASLALALATGSCSGDWLWVWYCLFFAGLV